MNPSRSQDVCLRAGADVRPAPLGTGAAGVPPGDSVSVVIPAMNAAGHIRRAIESVLRQTVRPREIIVVDDGSTDNTAAVVSEYGSATCLRQSHSGLSVARNEGVARSSSEWIAFLDADDEWLPTKVERQLAILGRYPGLRWCSCHRRDIGPGTGSEPQADVLAQLAARPVLPLVTAMASRLSVAPSGIVVQRGVLRDSGGFDPRLCYAQDRDLWLRIALRHPWIGYSPEVGLLYHSDTPDSLMKRYRERTEALGVVCRHLEIWRDAGNPSFQELGQQLIVDYLVRAASAEVSLDAATRAQAMRLAGLSLPERLLLAWLTVLPRRLARKLGSRFRKRPKWQPAIPASPPVLEERGRTSSQEAV
jgi:glycosyltransferase involved in cell wall biosynthesis